MSKADDEDDLREAVRAAKEVSKKVPPATRAGRLADSAPPPPPRRARVGRAEPARCPTRGRQRGFYRPAPLAPLPPHPASLTRVVARLP